jgi:multisubunit Na+/H+ antiporter MnhB subunit
LVLVVMAVASVAVYLLMRYPGMRRPQFQGRRAFSVGVSLACAVGLFVLFAALTWVLQTP